MSVQYAILPHPGHARVFFDDSGRIAEAELLACAGRMTVPARDIAADELEGLHCLTFSAPAPLPPRDIALLSRLSFSYALFLRRGDLLLPQRLPEPPLFDGGLSSMLKYSGKTSEMFTRLLLNMALAATDFDPLDRLELLDPMCGKGTTLFEAVTAGHYATGLDIAAKPVQEAAAFFRQYLERGRYKHSYERQRPGPNQKLYPCQAHVFAFARDRQGMEDPGRLTAAAGDARHADRLFGKARFHAVCADLPYGVQHGSVRGGRGGTRNPAALVAECLPAWTGALKPGGVIALSWNTFLLSRGQLGSVLEQGGLRVVSGPGYHGLEHRVDQAIRRDLIVAKFS